VVDASKFLGRPERSWAGPQSASRWVGAAQSSEDRGGGSGRDGGVKLSNGPGEWECGVPPDVGFVTSLLLGVGRNLSRPLERSRRWDKSCEDRFLGGGGA